MAIGTDWERSRIAEQRVLADIQARTGRSFPRIEAIDTSVAGVRAVLPILADWVDLINEENIRAAIYTRFHTPHANRYVGQMLLWARREVSWRGRDALVQGLVVAVRSKDGPQVWRELSLGPLSDFDAMLMAKLSTFPSVAREVKDYVLGMLESGKARISDLQYIADVEDPRILDWFIRRSDSPDSRLRRIAERVVSKGKRLPRGCSYAESGPNFVKELFSAEVNTSEVNRIFAEIAEKFKVKIPKNVRESSIWARAEVDRWIKVHIDSANVPSPTLWIRLEDVDVAQIVFGV